MPPDATPQWVDWQLECIQACVDRTLQTDHTDETASASQRFCVQCVDGRLIRIQYGTLLLELCPTYPGSVLNNAVTVRATHSDQVVTGPLMPDYPRVIKAHLSEHTHYTRFHTVPLSTTSSFYQQTHPRITFFTSRAPALSKHTMSLLQTFWQYQDAASNNSVHVNWCPMPATLLDFPGSSRTYRECVSRQPKGEIPLAHDTISSVSLQDRAAIISKSDLIITDHCGVLVDAIASSVPVGLDTHSAANSAMQSSFEAYLQHKNRLTVTVEQQAALAQQDHLTRANAQLVHTQLELRELLTHLIPHANLTSTDECEDSPGLSIITPYQAQTPVHTRINTLDGRLHNGRRKWQKFRESPKRFIDDSHHWALKPVKGFAR